MDIGFADDGDPFLVHERVRGTGHDADLALQRVPALDGDCIAAVEFRQVFHCDFQRRDVLQFIFPDRDLHIGVTVLHDFTHGGSLCFDFPDFRGQLRHGDR